jgi:hypothetical protein
MHYMSVPPAIINIGPNSPIRPVKDALGQVLRPGDTIAHAVLSGHAIVWTRYTIDDILPDKANSVVVVIPPTTWHDGGIKKIKPRNVVKLG